MNVFSICNTDSNKKSQHSLQIIVLTTMRDGQITVHKIPKIINKCIKHRNEPFHGGMGSKFLLLCFLLVLSSMI